MNAQAEEMKQRTKRFGLRVLRLVESLPKGRAADVVARQLARAATSVGANYHAACRARSKPDFIAKLGIVEEEADETLFWLELLVDGQYIKPELVSDLQREASEILAIVVSSINTARGGRRSARPQSAIRIPHSAIP